jgi:hypothetical protein
MAVDTQFGFATAGLTPVITTSIAGHSPDGWVPVAIYALIICAISAAALLAGPETHRTPLNQLGERRRRVAGREQAA